MLARWISLLVMLIEFLDASKELTLGERLQLIESKIDKTSPTDDGKRTGPLSASSASVLVQQINKRRVLSSMTILFLRVV